MSSSSWEFKRLGINLCSECTTGRLESHGASEDAQHRFWEPPLGSGWIWEMLWLGLGRCGQWPCCLDASAGHNGGVTWESFRWSQRPACCRVFSARCLVNMDMEIFKDIREVLSDLLTFSFHVTFICVLCKCLLGLFLLHAQPFADGNQTSQALVI